MCSSDLNHVVTFLLPEKLPVLHLLLMNISVPTAIAHVHNMVTAIWIIMHGEGEQILNAVYLPAALTLLKMRNPGQTYSSNLEFAGQSYCASPILTLFSVSWLMLCIICFLGSSRNILLAFLASAHLEFMRIRSSP